MSFSTMKRILDFLEDCQSILDGVKEGRSAALLKMVEIEYDKQTYSKIRPLTVGKLESECSNMEELEYIEDLSNSYLFLTNLPPDISQPRSNPVINKIIEILA